MSKHSPGPWTVHVTRVFDNDGTREDVGVSHAGGSMVTQRCFNPADAQLIASAPEMLELLRTNVDERHFWNCGNPRAPKCEGSADGPCWAHRVRSLIARIEGEP